MLLSDRIAMLAPAGASHYQLTVRLANGVVRRYPAEAGTFFPISRPPGLLPDGRYTIRYFDQALQSLADADRELVVDSLAAATSPTAQCSPASADVSGRVTSPATRAETAASNEGARPLVDRSLARQQLRERYLAEKDPERRRQLLKAAEEERQMSFVQNSVYARELGEVFLLNRMMRQELLMLHDVIVNEQRSAYPDMKQVRSTVLGLQELQKEVLEHVKATLGTVDKSPPTPDYVGLGRAALATAQEIGIAATNRGSTFKADDATTGSDSARLPTRQQK